MKPTSVRVYRIGDHVAISTEGGEVYLTPAEARQLRTALSRTLWDIRDCEFSVSYSRTWSLNVANDRNWRQKR